MQGVTDPSLLEVQGALFLSDIEKGGGGFICVDGFHKWWAEWSEQGGLAGQLPDGVLRGKPFAEQPFK